MRFAQVDQATSEEVRRLYEVELNLPDEKSL